MSSYGLFESNHHPLRTRRLDLFWIYFCIIIPLYPLDPLRSQQAKYRWMAPLSDSYDLCPHLEL